MKKRWVMAVVVALVVIGSMQAAQMRPSVARGQSGSDAPYLYYFSGHAHAWVIERADGTDRRLFGYGVIPPELNEAGYVQWSPSGNWLSWIGYNNCTLPGSYVGCIENKQWMVLGGDGQHQLNSLQGHTIETLTWSPTDDLLLVREPTEYGEITEPESPGPVVHVHYTMIDTRQDRILWEFDRSFAVTVAYVRDRWLVDGQTVVLDYGIGDWDTQQRSVVTIGRDGQRTERTILTDQFNISPTGLAVYRRGLDLWLTDLKTGQVNILSLGALQNLDFGMQWTAKGDAALISVQGPNHTNFEYFYALWWLDLKTRQFYPIAPQARQYSISPSARFVDYIDESQTLYYFDISTKQVASLRQIDEYTNLQWTYDDQLLIWATAYQDHEDNGALENLAMGQTTTITIPTPIYGVCGDPPQLSSDSRYLAWYDVGPLTLDLMTDEQVMFREDARGFFSSGGGWVRWHPHEAWFLAFDSGLISSGGCGPIYGGVVAADGSFQREIYAYDVMWLPDGVRPSDMPLDSTPRPPAPIMILHGTDYSEAIEWSPDGRFLLADNNAWWLNPKAYLQPVLLWDVPMGQVVSQVSPPRFDRCLSQINPQVQWQQVPSGVFVPTAMTPPAPIEWVGWDMDTIQTVSHDQKLVLSSADGWQILAADTHQPRYTIPKDIWVWCASFSPDGRLFAVTNPFYKPMLRIWDTETWELLTEIEIAGLGMAFSPDGEYLAVGVSWDVEIWRVSDLIGQSDGSE